MVRIILAWHKSRNVSIYGILNPILCRRKVKSGKTPKRNCTRAGKRNNIEGENDNENGKKEKNFFTFIGMLFICVYQFGGWMFERVFQMFYKLWEAS